MKKVIILILPVLIIICTGLFTVSQREKAVVTSYFNSTKVYATGLHFAWPLINQIHYVYINQRSSELTIPLTFQNPIKTKVQVSVLINWQVIQPAIYLGQLTKLNNVGMDKEITAIITAVMQKTALTFPLIKFNQLPVLINAPLTVEKLGIQINQLSLINLQVLSKQNPEVYSLNKVNPTMVTNSALESAYYQAQLIKTNTEIKVAHLYQSIKVKDPRFYEYFRKIVTYRNSARSKAEIPPLSQLYP